MINTKTITGLYIGENSVEFAVLSGTLKGPKLVKSGKTYIYPENATEKDKEQTSRDHYIVDAMRRLFKENNIKPLNVVFGISGRDVMVRSFQMPKIPKGEWNTAVNFEAARYIPLPMEQIISDFKVFQNLPSSNDMDVVFVAVRQNVIRHFIKLLQSVGIKSAIIEPAPFSLIRVFAASGQINTDMNALIVNLDITTANISILRKGVPYIIRDVSLEPDEASSAEATSEKIISDIKLSLDFYKKKFPSEPIDKIIIDSLMPIEDLQHLVGKELGIPVEVGDPLKGINIEKETPSKLSIAFALALRGLSKSSLDLTLRIEGLLDYKQRDQFLKVLYLEASVVGILLVILKVLSMQALEPLTSELNITISSRPNIKKEIALKTDNITKLNKVEADIKERIDLLEGMIPKRTYVTAKLNELTELVPNNLWLTELDFRETLNEKDPKLAMRYFNINGYCVSDEGKKEEDTVRDFLADLEASSAINSGMRQGKLLSVEKSELEGEKVASFEISFEGL